MAQGEFTKCEAQFVLDAVADLFDGLSVAKRANYAPQFLSVVLFVCAAKRAAPETVPIEEEG